jgi:phenylalanyl-tRNA synthetase alpha chain
MSEKNVLPEIDYLVLTALSGRDQPVDVMALAEELGQDQSKVTAACISRAELGQIELEERAVVELRLGGKGRELAGKPLPERTIIEALARNDGSAGMPELAGLTGLEPKEVGQSLRWLKSKGWADKQGKAVTLSDGGRQALEARPGPDEQLIAALVELGTASPDELARRDIDLEAALALLEGRTGVVDQRERTRRLVRLGDAGRALVAGGIETRRQINQLTSELLISGEWRGVDIRPYDVSLPSEPVYPGKEHPLVSILQQTRRVFLEMGFSEIVSPYVESSFWDFDALFQPQDHPARDMQDTFYIGRPERCRLPAEELVARVRRTHEDGGDTGSVGWRYEWDAELAHRPVLRTHTTATTIRALAADPRPPRKVFCVGPVFRRETVDYKHLPMFHQVDGIIIDEHGSFASLLGTLSAFYSKMGFSRFQFRPAFFPYTEPSVEVFVWAEAKRDWIEMGGAGMFRPEVTEPLGCEVPVLAWGLGLERLALFRYNLSSIGELYKSRMSWLKEAALCRW